MAAHHTPESREAMAVAKEIQRQLGGKTLMMLGAKDLLAIGRGVGNGRPGLMFRIRGSKLVNHIVIQLDPDDTYSILFAKIGRDYKSKTVKEVSGIYFDQLHDIIEKTTGLYTRLNPSRKKIGVRAPPSAHVDDLAWAYGATRRELVDGVWQMVPVESGTKTKTKSKSKKHSNPGGRKPPSPGSLPPKGQAMLGAVYESAKKQLGKKGVRGKKAKAGAAKQAWCAVKRQYKKVGTKWSKRKRPLGPDEQPPGCTPLRRLANRLKRS